MKAMLTRSILIVLSAFSTFAFAQENPAGVSSERARANFAQPIVLAPDDVRAFNDPRPGFNKPRSETPSGAVEVFEYDSAVTGTRTQSERVSTAGLFCEKEVPGPIPAARHRRR